MRACVIKTSGGLSIEHRQRREPSAGEVAIDIAYGGICGSDLHYFHDGGAGEFTITEPLVTGHEVVGRIAALGAGVTQMEVGQSVAVHPAQVCGGCQACLRGEPHLCPHSRYLGSAAHTPHIQGGFTEQLIVAAARAFPLPAGMTLRRAALAEPFSVAYHAMLRAGDLAGKTLLVTGAGPIGCLAVAAAKHAGAGTIIATDLTDHALGLAEQMGADVLLRADRAAPHEWPNRIDVAIEASGTASGLNSCIRAVRPGARIVQVGILPPGTTSILGNALVNKEIQLHGSWRFHTEFAAAIALLATEIDPEPLITHEFDLDDAEMAFLTASDRRTASKVLLRMAPAEAAGPAVPRAGDAAVEV